MKLLIRSFLGVEDEFVYSRSCTVLFKQAIKMKVCFKQLTLSLQRKVACFLSIPVDHFMDTYGGSTEKEESGSAGAQWSHHVLEQNSISQSSQKCCDVKQHPQTQTSLQPLMPYGDLHWFPGFLQLW